jgi:hypothetical protein
VPIFSNMAEDDARAQAVAAYRAKIMEHREIEAKSVLFSLSSSLPHHISLVSER